MKLLNFNFSYIDIDYQFSTIKTYSYQIKALKYMCKSCE